MVASAIVGSLALVLILNTGKPARSGARLTRAEQRPIVRPAVQAHRSRLASVHASTTRAPYTKSAPAPSHSPAALAKMIGQQLMVRMDGPSADPGLLARIRDGQVGGVILYSDNIQSPSQVQSLVGQLQTAAHAGGNPPLLIATDQEGGQVKRLPWAPPDLSAMQMGAAGGTVAQDEGDRTGSALRAVGINVDLAPVVDVAAALSSFIWRQQRSFGMSARQVDSTAVPFATGLERAGVAPTAKHFPGLGAATTDTDVARASVVSQPADLLPYDILIPSGVPLIMVSTAAFPSLDSSGTPGALSKRIITGELRNALNFRGVVITDDLERPTGYSVGNAAIRAVNAGADIVLAATTEQGGASAYDALLSAAQSGAVTGGTVTTAYRRILVLKRRYASSY